MLCCTLFLSILNWPTSSSARTHPHELPGQLFHPISICTVHSTKLALTVAKNSQLKEERAQRFYLNNLLNWNSPHKASQTAKPHLKTLLDYPCTQKVLKSINAWESVLWYKETCEEVRKSDSSSSLWSVCASEKKNFPNCLSKPKFIYWKLLAVTWQSLYWSNLWSDRHIVCPHIVLCQLWL